MQKSIIVGAAIAVSLFGVASMATGQSGQERVKRGQYLASLTDCGGCHTSGALLGKPDPQHYLAGSEVGFQMPGLGIFFPPNLTSDRETGLGAWSEADFVKAVRTGERPDGRMLVPAMPYQSYGKLTDSDAFALAAYIKGLKPIRNKVPVMIGVSEKPAAAYLTVVMLQP